MQTIIINHSRRFVVTNMLDTMIRITPAAAAVSSCFHYRSVYIAKTEDHQSRRLVSLFFLFKWKLARSIIATTETTVEGPGRGRLSRDEPDTLRVNSDTRCFSDTPKKKETGILVIDIDFSLHSTPTFSVFDSPFPPSSKLTHYRHSALQQLSCLWIRPKQSPPQKCQSYRYVRQQVEHYLYR